MDKWIDLYMISVSKLFLGKNLWFSSNLDSPTIGEHVRQIQMERPISDGTGIYEVRQESLAGVLDPAYHIVQWLGTEYPVIIYHHGNNETPFKYSIGSKNTFKSLFLDTNEPIEANLISIRAPFHNNGLKYYMDKIRDLNNFAALLAGSVKLEEELILSLREMGVSNIICSGISLGGWVTNLHRTFFNSADMYVPLCAGAALDDVFTDSVYTKLTAEVVRQNRQHIQNVLNFEKSFLTIKSDNIRPLLARHDQIIRYEVHSKSYGGHDITTLEKGHVTSVLAIKDLRHHITSSLAQSQADFNQ